MVGRPRATWMAATWTAAALTTAAGVAASCAPAPVDPGEVGGTWLETPTEVSCRIAPQFSPDGAQLAFWMETSPDPATVPPVVRLGIMDWPSKEVRLPAGLPDDLSLRPGSLCWNEEESRLHVAGSPDHALRDPTWFRMELDGGGDLMEGDPPPVSCQVMTPSLWESHRPHTHTPEIEQGVEVSQLSDREVVLRGGQGRELARHRPIRTRSSSLSVHHFAVSSSGHWLAYTLGEGWAGMTAGPSQSHLVSLHEGEPQLLGSGVHTLLWRGDDELVGCARNLSTRDERLVHWSVAGPPPGARRGW